MAGATVECEGVTRIYRRGTPTLRQRLRRGEPTLPSVVALDDVDLSIDGSEFVGIAGPSGSGKSTLLHLIAGLDRPTAGRVLVDGTDVGALTGRARTRFRLDQVGVVFQHFHLLGSLSARANVALPLVERGVPKRDRRERATALLEHVGLGDRVDHRPTELSGGEQQRVAIARALATDPPLVVADEPTGELDSTTTDRVLDVLAQVGDERTVVMASHDAQSLERTDRIVQMRDGRPVAGASHRSQPGRHDDAVNPASDPTDRTTTGGHTPQNEARSGRRRTGENRRRTGENRRRTAEDGADANGRANERRESGRERDDDGRDAGRADREATRRDGVHGRDRSDLPPDWPEAGSTARGRTRTSAGDDGSSGASHDGQSRTGERRRTEGDAVEDRER